MNVQLAGKTTPMIENPRSKRRTFTTELDRITKKIIQVLRPEKIILFGSHVWGKPHASSDIDLFIIVPSSDLPGHTRATNVYRALRGTPRSFPLDVIVRTTDEVKIKQKVPTSLARKVLTQGKIIYG